MTIIGDVTLGIFVISCKPPFYGLRFGGLNASRVGRGMAACCARYRRRVHHGSAVYSTAVNRRPIQQLSQSLVNRIAAGEVIERPASVVRELVDNAIDAGAQRVIVEIEDGGRELVRVIDDGGGIPAGELPLAFMAHATSKLSSDEDLFEIQTLGFRGEALASIGSVSQARIVTRTADADAAYEVFNRGGELSDPQATAGNVGTTIEVRHLFFNVPARRKFLKGTQTEFGHAVETLLKLALPRPGVAFVLKHNGRIVREYAATGEVERLLTAWPDEFREQRLPLAARDAEMILRGIVGLPELASPTAKHQHVYVNGRPVRDKFIQHALREAYRGLTEPGRYPAAVLLLELPPGDVDVNVHPTKSEVRFKDSGRIHGLVMSGVREVLLGSDLTPRATARPDWRSNIQPAAPPERSTPAYDMQQRLAAFFKAPLPVTQQPHLPSLPPSPPSGESRGEGTWNHGNASVSDLPAPQTNWRPFSNPIPLADRDTPAATSPYPNPIPEGQEAKARSSAIQLHNTYLVVESDEGMVIIDQHALHERILYEEILGKITAGPLETQRMLIPLTLRASSRQLDLLEQVKPMLAKLGIDVEPFGPDSVAIQGFPSFLDRLDPADFVHELLERGEQELLDLTEEELLHGVLDMMACKAAVKAGDPLTPQEIEALLKQRHLVDRASNCPHGRPTTLKLSLRDLEKQFKRTGF